MYFTITRTIERKTNLWEIRGGNCGLDKYVGKFPQWYNFKKLCLVKKNIIYCKVISICLYASRYKLSKKAGETQSFQNLRVSSWKE